jgi:hypothetical protein
MNVRKISSVVFLSVLGLFVPNLVYCYTISEIEGDVSAKFTTEEIPNSFRPPDGSSSLYFFGLNTIIVRAEILVKASPIVVPFDSFAGLGDPKSVRFKTLKTDRLWRVIINGGDASSAYCAFLDFDKKQIRKVTIMDNCSSKIATVVKQYRDVPTFD